MDRVLRLTRVEAVGRSRSDTADTATVSPAAGVAAGSLHTPVVLM